jgi:hypothetical protein
MIYNWRDSIIKKACFKTNSLVFGFFGSNSVSTSAQKMATMLFQTKNKIKIDEIYSNIISRSFFLPFYGFYPISIFMNFRTTKLPFLLNIWSSIFGNRHIRQYTNHKWKYFSELHFSGQCGYLLIYLIISPEMWLQSDYC